MRVLPAVLLFGLSLVSAGAGAAATNAANPCEARDLGFGRKEAGWVQASGRDGLGAWQAVQRNLGDDYRRAFGAEPGAVSAIA